MAASLVDAANVPEELVTQAALPDITCPALIVQGTDAEYATEQHAIDIDAALPNSELWLILGAGLVPHTTLGDEFNQRVASFFARTSAL